MKRLYAVPLGLFALAASSAVEAFPELAGVRVDPCAMLVTYLAFRFDLVGGVLTAALLGLLLDVASGAPTGLHMASLEVLFVAFRIVANAVQLTPGVRVLPLALGGAFMHAVLVSFMIGVVRAGAAPVAGAWQSSLPSMLGNVVLGLPLLWVAHRLGERWVPDGEHMFIAR